MDESRKPRSEALRAAMQRKGEGRHEASYLRRYLGTALHVALARGREPQDRPPDEQK